MSFFFSFCFFGFVSNWDPLFSLNKQNHFCRRRRAIENFSFYDLEVGEVGVVAPLRTKGVASCMFLYGKLLYAKAARN